MALLECLSLCRLLVAVAMKDEEKDVEYVGADVDYTH